MASVVPKAKQPLTPAQFQSRLSSTALAFRGYDTSNLGLTAELLESGLYGPLIESHLRRASVLCSEIKSRRVDLVDRVLARRETSLATYDEAICLVLAVEAAQLACLREHFSIDIAAARFSYGFSLGEIAALIAGGVLEMEDALSVLLKMADDCAALAEDVTLAVVFSRRGQIVESAALRLCQEINATGKGVVGVSTFLAPNSLLFMGQHTAIDELAKRTSELSTERVYLRRNSEKWPPLHTPIVWQRNIPNRAQVLMHQMPVRMQKPIPNVFSLVTGAMSYQEHNAREIIGFWVDHPQRLWSAVDYTLACGVDTLIHVGPSPNIIPATFDRLADNVLTQTNDSVRMRALSGMVNRPWLQNILPRRAALLRAPRIRHIVLEQWLLANEPASTTSGRYPVHTDSGLA